MKNRLLHTPEGVRDLYDDACERKIALDNQLMQVMRGYGYHPIQTPTFEYFDIFSHEIGTTPSNELYKFFDREGNTLVLRPEITPSIARCAATYFADRNVQIRLCYMGNTFINNNSYQGLLKERTQVGAELIGDAVVDADAEIITMAIDMLKRSGLNVFQMSIGHVNYLRGLFEESGFDDDMQEELTDLIENRNYFGVEEIVSKLNLNDDLIYLFFLLKNMVMTIDQIREARTHADNFPKIADALDRLLALDEILEYYEVKEYVSYELAHTSKIEYYTGIIFAAYTYGSGEAILTGGRYDKLLALFGTDAPAIGFAIITDQLLKALSRQGLDNHARRDVTWIVYSEKHRRQALGNARMLRDHGIDVELLVLSDRITAEKFKAYADEYGVSEVIYYVD